MLETLFYIPESIGPYPVFGFGLLLLIWAVTSVGILAWLARRQGITSDTWSYVPLLLLIAAIILWVLPGISDPGLGLPVHGYGVMLLSGVLAGTGLTIYRARPLGIPADLILTLAFWAFVPGIVGARLFYILKHWQEFHTPGMEPVETAKRILNLTQGGLAVQGSLFGGLAGMVFFLAKRRVSPLAMLDLCAPGMMAGLALGRIGCFFHGCCFGGACDLPWAVEFPAGSPPYLHQAENGAITLPSLPEVREGRVFAQGLKVVGSAKSRAVITEVERGSPAEERGLRAGQTLLALGAASLRAGSAAKDALTVDPAQRALAELYRDGPVLAAIVADPGQKPVLVRWRATGPPMHGSAIHPTQIYSSIDAMVLCLFLLAYGPFAGRDGQVIAMLLTVYPVTRFLMEMIRTDEPKDWSMGFVHLNVFQVVSLGLLVGAVVLWTYILSGPPGKTLERQAAAAG